MLSDEEREAIDLLKNIDKQKCVMLECPVVKNNIERQLKIIELNRTIRKQSKEIEELKDTRSIFNMGRRSYKNEIEGKIKAKIEKIDMTGEIGYLVKGILQSLLEKE